tara:strand:+ start:315 stop:2018 length:1704 start_codon:yes stop_codon:yes gene_type:complete
MDGYSPLFKFVPNPGGQATAWKSTADVVFISGANRAGKSTLLCHLAASYLLPHPYEEDYSYYPTIPDWDGLMPYMSDETVALRQIRKVKLPTIVWFSTSSMGGHRDVAMRYFPELLGDFIENIEMSDEQGVWARIILKNGSELHLKSKSQGIAAFQRAKIDLMINDEPFSQGLYGEQIARLLDKRGRMVIGATAIASDQMTSQALKESEWLIETFAEGKRKGTLPDNVDVIPIPLSENPYIDIKHAERLYALLPEMERRARFDGDMVILQGECFFNRAVLARLTDEVVVPETGYMSEDLVMDTSPIGPKQFTFRIWNEPDPLQNYVIGIDPSSGREDPSCVRVWAEQPRHLVAEGRGWISEDKLPHEIMKLVKYYGYNTENKRYNNIVCNVETNQGRLTLSALQYGNTELGVKGTLPRLYYRPKPNFLGKGIHYPSDIPGWQTTSSNRSTLLSQAQSVLAYASTNTDINVIPDEVGLKEDYYWFVWENGKAQAKKGYHDDRVIADSLAWLGFRQNLWRHPVDVGEEPIEAQPFQSDHTTISFDVFAAIDKHFEDKGRVHDIKGVIYG